MAWSHHSMVVDQARAVSVPCHAVLSFIYSSQSCYPCKSDVKQTECVCHAIPHDSVCQLKVRNANQSEICHLGPKIAPIDAKEATAETVKGLKAVALSAVNVVTSSVIAEALVVAAEADHIAPEAAEVIPTTLVDVLTVILPAVTTDAAPAAPLALVPLISAEERARQGETTVTIEAVLPLVVVAAAQAQEITGLPTDLLSMNVKALVPTVPSALLRAQEVLLDAISEDHDRETTRQDTNLPQAIVPLMTREYKKMEPAQKQTDFMMERRATTSKDH